MSLLKQSYVYKPFLYPWAMEFGTEHDLMHWVAEELKFVDDIRHWQTVAKTPYEDGLLPEEKSLIGNILKLFTTSDVVVAGNYCDVFIPVFKNNEIRQMLLAFANIERVHQKAYALLNDTLAIDEGEYAAFTSIPALHNKVDFMSSARFHVDFSKGEEAYRNLALALVQTVINEGVGLFSSFAMLMNVTRKGKMPTMGKVVELSVRDEARHAEGMIKLFRVLVEDEHRYLIDDEFKREVYDMFREAIRLEDAVIDAAFELGGVPDMTPDLMKTFIRHMADRRLVSLGFKANWGVETNPLPWFEELLGAVKQTNFFELRPTEYAKTTSAGDDYF